MKNRYKPNRIQNEKHSDYEGNQELVDTEESLLNYSREIIKKFYSHMNLQNRIQKLNGHLLEFGAGTGFLSTLFRDMYGISPYCVEIDPKLCKILKEKNFESFQYLHEIDMEFSAVFTSNVLVHIENDVAALVEIREKLIPKGCIGIYVPAHPVLYSQMDAKIGHVRRYRKDELITKVVKAGFEVNYVCYDDFIGFFASLSIRLLGWKKSFGLGNKKSLMIYDKILYPISKILDFIGFRYIVGKNLFLVATKK